MQNGKKTEIQRKRQEIQLQKYSLEYKNTNANTNTNTNTKMLECHCTPEEKVFFGNFLKLECQFKFSSLIFFRFSLLGNISHYIHSCAWQKTKIGHCFEQVPGKLDFSASMNDDGFLRFSSFRVRIAKSSVTFDRKI